jgi:bromodomain-containing factor 1
MSQQKKKQKLIPGGEAEKLVKQCHSVLKALQKLPGAWPFLAPVDWKALKLPTYPKIVKYPMDLGTVESKLLNGRYAIVRDFSGDMSQIWANAHMFNQA